ncbi:MAG: cytochrome-c peroxidase, partial [Haemophilus parainfluenzae]
MQKKWLSILLFAPLMQSNYALADQAEKKELDYKALGEVLFFDKSISFNKTQSCSTCHSPDTAFVDQRKNSANQMVSEGDNPHLHGNRNANTALYAMFSPDFHFDKKIKDYVGGQFWDGRAKDLAEQAGGPPVNPVEMGMPDKKAIV